MGVIVYILGLILGLIPIWKFRRVEFLAVEPPFSVSTGPYDSRAIFPVDLVVPVPNLVSAGTDDGRAVFSVY